MKVTLSVLHTEFEDDLDISIQHMDTETAFGGDRFEEKSISQIFRYADYLTRKLYDIGELSYVEVTNTETKEVLWAKVVEPKWWDYELFMSRFFEEDEVLDMKFIIDKCHEEVLIFKKDLFDLYSQSWDLDCEI